MLLIEMEQLFVSSLTSLQPNLLMMSPLTRRHNPEEAEESAIKDLTPSILIICDILVWKIVLKIVISKMFLEISQILISKMFLIICINNVVLSVLTEFI